MQRNIELLQQTMQHIKDHPEEHNQATWINISKCGTAACFAGRAALLSGRRTWEALRIGYDGGAQLLGLSLEEAATLFAATNTVPMLELMVNDLVNDDELREVIDYHREIDQ